MMVSVDERVTLGQSTAQTQDEHLCRYDFARQFVKGKDVADIACGTGYGTQILARAGARSVHGMDVSEEAVAYCRESCELRNVTYNVADAQKLTAVSDSGFDLVVSFETIEHLPDVEAYLDEMVRILRPGGTFIVSTPDRRLSSLMHPFRGCPSNPFHVREYTEAELLKLLSTRFHIQACYGQSFVPRWLVFWPVQFALRAACRLIGTPRALEFKDKLFSDGGNAEVKQKTSPHSIPKFWVVACTRHA